MTIGDVVRLKSGGPLMTINNDSDTYALKCCWFQDGLYGNAVFHPGCLDLVPNFSATSSAPMPADKPCRCGHDLYIEHSNVGCLQGCAHDLCAPEDGQHGL